MGERLERALKMPLSGIVSTLATWRRMGGSKLTILGGEPSLHPNYVDAIRFARKLGYEHVITTTNAQGPALRKFRQLAPEEFAYIQVSVDGGSPGTNDLIRGTGTFSQALSTIAELTRRGFDTRIICTVNQANAGDALRLLDIADDLAVEPGQVPCLLDHRDGRPQSRAGHDAARVGGVLRPPARGGARPPGAGLVPADVRPA